MEVVVIILVAIVAIEVVLRVLNRYVAPRAKQRDITAEYSAHYSVKPGKELQ